MIDIIERLQRAETRPLAGTDSWVELWKVLSDARIALTRLEAINESLRREVREQRREIAGLREERRALVAADRPMRDRPEAINTAESDRPQPIERTPNQHATPGEGSVPSEGASEPMAWWVKGCEYDTGCEYEFVALLKEQAELAATNGGKAVPLYRSPTLTDAEREAIAWFAEAGKPLARLTQSHNTEQYRATLRGLLGRTRLG